jgi:hypothetical protein
LELAAVFLSAELELLLVLLELLPQPQLDLLGLEDELPELLDLPQLDPPQLE